MKTFVERLAEAALTNLSPLADAESMGRDWDSLTPEDKALAHSTAINILKAAGHEGSDELEPAEAVQRAQRILQARLGFGAPKPVEQMDPPEESIFTRNVRKRMDHTGFIDLAGEPMFVRHAMVALKAIQLGNHVDFYNADWQSELTDEEQSRFNRDMLEEEARRVISDLLIKLGYGYIVTTWDQVLDQ